MARVAYATKETAQAKSRDIFEKYEARNVPVLNIFRTVLNSPGIGPHFLRLGSAILDKSEVPPYLRELAILRVGHLTGANYEWTQHVRIGLECGVSQAQIDAIPDWQNAEVFDDEDRAILRFTDEVTQNVKASDEAFAAVRKFFSEQLMVELTMTVGFYNLVSRLLETMEVELET